MQIVKKLFGAATGVVRKMLAPANFCCDHTQHRYVGQVAAVTERKEASLETL
jgi:hypothetical protein